ncbi:hypothetical protein AB4Z38_16930 [Arthrobacter sp. 2RAF6]|uniref:hypothetical protein n=1 Tax=Arthrobacter sp. 2RAF6 TaxID=3233002 RepID=UPI003F90C51A
MNLRASEELQQHTQISKRLAAESEKRRQELYALIPGGEEAFVNGVIASGSQNDLAIVEAARDAADAAQAAEVVHNSNDPDPVRNYKVTSLDFEEEYEHFTSDFGSASMVAAKLMAGKGIDRYDLQEQLRDSSWVTFYKEHEGREAS